MKTQILMGLGFSCLVGCASDDGVDEKTRKVGTPGDPEDLSVADASHCAATDNWDPAWVELEEAVREAVNEERERGATCDGRTFGPTYALLMDPALQCAARLHSKDMADSSFFDHDSPSGEDPWGRIDAAGFTGFAGGENIAAGRATATDTVEQWMASGGHCANIMNPDFQFIGVGYHPGGEYGHVWTQTFGNAGN